MTVVGAGFSGLATAFYLLNEGFEVRVVEMKPEPGGLIHTVEDHLGLTETAANAILNTERVEHLFRTIGLEILPTLRASRKRFIFRDGKPVRWPFGFWSSFKLLRFMLIFFLRRTNLCPRSGESVRHWGHRVLNGEITQYGIEPALQGIYAGDPDRLSATLIFGKYFQRKKPLRHPKPKVRGSVSASGGMGQIISTLHEYLVERGVKFDFGHSFYFNDEVSQKTPVVLATSARSAAILLRPLDPDRANALAQIEMLPLLSTTAFFDSPVRRGNGFGCLFPVAEGKPMLGVLMNSSIFAGRAKQGYSETWIFGGASKQSLDALSLSDQEIMNLIERQRGECFLAVSDRLGARITRWPAAIPHYTTDFEKILPIIRRNRQNVFLMGNYTGEIGLSRMLERAASLAREVREEGDLN